MRTLKAALMSAAAIVLASAALFVSGPVIAAEIRNIDVVQGQAMMDEGALLLDVREPHEFDAGHVPGSTLIPLGQLENRLSEIRGYAAKPVVVICRSGRRSARAAAVLSRLGFTAVHNVSGGMLSWRAAGLPVATPGK